MRTPLRIVTPLLAAAAVSVMTGCRPAQMQRCVDENNNVVDDKLCANQPQALSNGQQQRMSDGHGGFLPLIIPYRYYYGGGGGYGLGSRVFGGGYSAAPGVGYSRGGGGFFGGISRGGFGSHFGGGGE